METWQEYQYRTTKEENEKKMKAEIKPSVPGVQINTDHYQPATTKRNTPIGKKIIYGCEGRGDGDQPYLTRYTLFQCRLFQLCLHVFHRSDHDDHHNHPWNFTSIILWRGYYEETMQHETLVRKRVWPGMVLRRKATHRHRVVLKDGKKAVTLVIMGKYRQTWGFFTSEGWVRWKEYFVKNKC